MRRFTVVALTFVAIVAVGLSPALAWQCPVHLKAAEEAIKKAEALSMPADARGLLEQAKKMFAEARKHHMEGNVKIDHANSMWKAKAALAMAEAAATISTP